MARKARVKSTTGVYHTFAPCVDGLQLVTDQEDHDFYLSLLRDLVEESRCIVYAYSLHPNYIHLLIKEGTDDIGQIMKRLGTRYSYYYNVKYNHYGTIYNQRFRSQPIEDRPFFLRVLDFIASQPVEFKAILTHTIPSLPADPVTPTGSSQEIVDYKSRPTRITELGLLSYLQTHHSFTNIGEFLLRPLDEQTRVIADCKLHGGSVRQLAKLTGMPYQQVFRAK